MTNEKIFRTFWNNYREEMISMINNQFALQGAIEYEVVNRRFQSGINRWSSSMTPEGNWLQNLDDEQEKAEILQVLKTLSLRKPEMNNNVSRNAGLIFGTCGGALGTGMGILMNFPAPLCGVCLLAGAGIGYMVASSRVKEQKILVQKAVITAYRQQLNDAEELVAAIWRNHDREKGIKL